MRNPPTPNPGKSGQNDQRPPNQRSSGTSQGHATISVGVGVDNPDARRLYERLGYTATGRIETYRYTYVDPDGDERSATETAEYLNKRLHA